MLSLEGTEVGPHLNARDLGGNAAADGRRLKPGIFFRHGSLHLLTPQGREDLASRGIKTFCDLRSAQEQEMYIFTYPGGVATVDVGLDKAALGPEVMVKAKEMMQAGAHPQLMAMTFMPSYTKEFQTFLGTAMNPENWPVAFGCVAGKDRTGFAAALLLHVLGVGKDDIVRDYLLSESSLAPWKEHILSATREGLLAYKALQDDPASTAVADFEAAHPNEAPLLKHSPPTAEQLESPESMQAVLDDVRDILGVKAEWLEAAFKSVEEDHKGVDAYVAALGIGAEQIELFRNAAFE